ncbi:hypothetical protein ACFOU0_13935 [Salinicoccus sesuvii]|uniref:Uncharacterized protein n=1 Tax=Salinicoccus sesuvii TaxID=868281 RepID=A0ABV7NAC9_9STAP
MEKFMQLSQKLDQSERENISEKILSLEKVEDLKVLFPKNRVDAK